MRGVAAFLIMMMLSSAFAGCLDNFSGNSSPEIQFTMSPNTNVRTGDTVTFNAAGSSDPDGDSLSFSWNFGDGNTGTGLTTTHSYNQDGSYDVKLTVSDGSIETTLTKTLTIVDSAAREPKAVIDQTKDDDCDGDEPPSGKMILVWVCEGDKDESDRSVEVSTTVTLDGSDSWAGCDPDDSSCYAEEYLVEWNWDLDLHTDSDGDGDTENDVDATGETYEWTDRPAGAWEVGLTVKDNNGLTSTAEMMVYVNYQGIWKDFVIDRRYQDPVIMTWDFPVTYDSSTKDKIRYLRVKLIYPAEDADQPFGGVDTENRLDLFIHNSTDEEVANTTAIGDDNRDAGDCAAEDRCVWMVIGGSTVRGFQDGEWTCDLQNEKTHNTDIKELIIELQYR